MRGFFFVHFTLIVKRNILLKASNDSMVSEVCPRGKEFLFLLPPSLDHSFLLPSLTPRETIICRLLSYLGHVFYRLV